MKKVNVLILLLPVFLFSCRSDDNEISCDATIIWKNNCTYESKDRAIKLIIVDDQETGELAIKILAPGKWEVGGFFSEGIEFGMEPFKYEKKWLILSLTQNTDTWQFYCRRGELNIGNINISNIAGETRRIEKIWLVDDSGSTRREMFLCLDPGEPLRP